MTGLRPAHVRNTPRHGHHLSKAYSAALEHNATNPTRLVPFLDGRGWYLVVNDALDLEWWRAMREAMAATHNRVGLAAIQQGERPPAVVA
jgi:hypothetical protein